MERMTIEDVIQRAQNWERNAQKGRKIENPEKKKLKKIIKNCTWTRKEIDLKSIRLSHDSYFMHENLGSRSGSSSLVGFECWPVYGCGKVSVAVARMMMSGHTGS
jgi:hypothetical protein